MANIYTKIVTMLRGKEVGSDMIGNKYYINRKGSSASQKRWVIYAKNDDASEVPSRYHAWLHYTIDEFPDDQSTVIASWQLPHQANMSGTKQAWRPDSAYGNGIRSSARSDYIPWLPK